MSVYDTLSSSGNCPRCWNKKGLMVGLAYDHHNYGFATLTTTYCPGCGWEPRLIRNRALHLLLEKPVLGGRLGKHEPNLLGLILFAGLAYLTVTQIIPQLLGAVSP